MEQVRAFPDWSGTGTHSPHCRSGKWVDALSVSSQACGERVLPALCRWRKLIVKRRMSRETLLQASRPRGFPTRWPLACRVHVVALP